MQDIASRIEAAKQTVAQCKAAHRETGAALGDAAHSLAVLQAEQAGIVVGSHIRVRNTLWRVDRIYSRYDAMSLRCTIIKSNGEPGIRTTDIQAWDRPVVVSGPPAMERAIDAMVP